MNFSRVLEESKEELNLTDKEAENFKDALKKKEFNDLLQDYMKELSDPKNRAETGIS